MKKSAASLLSVAFLALGLGASSLHAADATPGFSSGTTIAKKGAGPSFRKDKPAAETPGVVYGGVALDLYKQGPVLFSPMAPQKAYGKSYFSSHKSGPAEEKPTHTAQTATGGWSLFSVSF